MKDFNFIGQTFDAFKQLLPNWVAINNGVITVETINDFSTVENLFTFCGVADRLGFQVVVNKDGFAIYDSKNHTREDEILVLYRFVAKYLPPEDSSSEINNQGVAKEM